MNWFFISHISSKLCWDSILCMCKFFFFFEIRWQIGRKFLCCISLDWAFVMLPRLHMRMKWETMVVSKYLKEYFFNLTEFIFILFLAITFVSDYSTMWQQKIYQEWWYIVRAWTQIYHVWISDRGTFQTFSS